MVALHAYTTGYYGDINPLMRSGSIDGTPWKSVAVSANSALEKLQKVDNRTHAGTAFRGMSDMDDATVTRLFKKGKIFSDPAFTSSSANSDAAFSGNVKISIKSKNSVKIHDASFFPKEAEVLFRPNTKFNVKECTKTSSGTWEVKLEEI
jgi:hypothetical protein